MASQRRLVQRHLVGDTTRASIWVSNDSLADRGTTHRIPPEDTSYMGLILSQTSPQAPDGAVLVPVEKR